jgi:hypothetical protein
MDATQKHPPFKSGVNLGQLILAAISVGGTIMGFWINTSTRLSVLENNDKTYHDERTVEKMETQEFRKEIRGEFQILRDGQNDIKVTLQNKQDRK